MVQSVAHDGGIGGEGGGENKGLVLLRVVALLRVCGFFCRECVGASTVVSVKLLG